MIFSQFLKSAGDYLSSQGFYIEGNAVFKEYGFSADLYAKKSGRSLFVFFPYDDYFFIHDFSGGGVQSLDGLRSVHEKTREYINSLYRLPKALRYRVPNIITIAVSEKGFLPDLQRYAVERKESIAGGEKNSVFLVDLVNRIVISQGLETTHVDMLSIQFNRVNPSNRAYHIVCGMAQEFFAANP